MTVKKRTRRVARRSPPREVMDKAKPNGPHAATGVGTSCDASLIVWLSAWRSWSGGKGRRDSPVSFRIEPRCIAASQQNAPLTRAESGRAHQRMACHLRQAQV